MVVQRPNKTRPGGAVGAEANRSESRQPGPFSRSRSEKPLFQGASLACVVMLKVVRCDGFSNSAILVSMKHDKPPCVKPLMLRLPEELHEKIEAAALAMRGGRSR